MATISTETHLRETLGSPSDLTVAKVADHLTPLTRQFVERSPFVRPGAGSGDTFQVNGHAAVIDDPGLLAPSAVDGRAPTLGLLVTVEEAFTHCPKAFIRFDLWNPERHADRSDLPTSGGHHAGRGGRRPRRRDLRPRTGRALCPPRGPLLSRWPR